MAVIPINITKEDKIAIIAPHPDDECIGPGGVIALFPNQCDIFVMTDGSRGNKNVSPEKERIIRKNQFLSEMKFINVHRFYWMGYDDGALLGKESCMQKIDFSVYTKIFLPWGNDNHPDHTAANLYAYARIKQQKIKGVDIYEYEVHVPFHDVTHYIDITEVIDKKIKMIQFHKDQVSSVCYDELAVSLAKYRACQANKSKKYFETFVKVNFDSDDRINEVVLREQQIQKYRQFYRVFYKWLKVRQDGKSIADYIDENRVRNIAIYGFGDVGRLLYNELELQGVHVAEILDKRDIEIGELIAKLKKPLEGNRQNTVIVTAMSDFEEIEKELKQAGYKEVLSFEDIVNAI